MFDSPLFGGSSTGTYRLYARQPVFDGSDVSAWFADGFPHYVSDFGIAATGIPLQGTRVDVTGGDFLLAPLRPESFLAVTRETYPLRGLSVRVADASGQWNGFVGAAKYFQQPPGGGAPDPTLFGLERLLDRGANHFGVSISGVAHATHLESGSGGARGTILAGDYFRDLNATAKLYVETLSTLNGDLAGRFGAQLRNPGWDFSAQVYAFGDGFPYAVPIYRPGEKGIEIAGRVDLAHRWSLSGYGNYVRDPSRGGRSEFIGDVGVAWNPGGDLPHLRLDYAHDEATYDSSSIAIPGASADRIVLQASRSYTSQFWNLRAEHVLRDSAGSPARSQATFDYRRIVLADSFLTGSAVLQRDSAGGSGATVESAVERPFAAGWFYIAGLGAALIDRPVGNSGEGVARVGVARRFSRDGWYARLEVRVPFSIGVERAELATQTVSFDLGTRVGWHGSDGRARRYAAARGEPTGALEGRVTMSGKGIADLRVLAEGEPATVTGADGRFRIAKVRAGRLDVALDLARLDPRYAVIGGARRSVEIAGGRTERIEFVVEPRSFFQGSILACDGNGAVPVRGARVTISAEGFSRTTETSPLGAFQIDDIPPAPYRLTVEGGAEGRPAPGLPQTVGIDLREDVTGFVLRLRCDSTPSPRPGGASGDGDEATAEPHPGA